MSWFVAMIVVFTVLVLFLVLVSALTAQKKISITGTDTDKITISGDFREIEGSRIIFSTLSLEMNDKSVYANIVDWYEGGKDQEMKSLIENFVINEIAKDLGYECALLRIIEVGKTSSDFASHYGKEDITDVIIKIGYDSPNFERVIFVGDRKLNFEIHGGEC